MRITWKAHCAIACLALVAIAIATAYSQDVLRRLPPLITRLPPVVRRLPPVAQPETRLSPLDSDRLCRRLPPVGEYPTAYSKGVRQAAAVEEPGGETGSRRPSKPLVVSLAPPPAERQDDQAESLPPPAADAVPEAGETLPDFAPWWQREAAGAFRPEGAASPVDVDHLVLLALRHSARVRAISDNYLIQRTAITEAAAAFDVRTFTDTRFIQVNEPVGNTLTTGGPSRYLNENFKASAGLKRKTARGGNWELSQRIGLQDSNSVFFQPINQGNSRLSLSFSQPLLNKAGRAYNSSLITLAEIDTQIAQDQTSQELQEHLLKVTRAYWELHLARAALLQKRKLYERGRQIQVELDSRQDIDAAQNQLVRARAAVSTRRAELVRAEATIKNAEARIRALVNAPEMLADVRLELIPTEAPAKDYFPVEVGDARATALQNRPEVDQAMRQIQAAHVKLNVSKNELRPVLDLVLEGYVTGLQGQYNLGESFAEQFNRGAPSYTAGLVYEYPWNNRAARSRYQRRQLELRQLMEQFDAALAQLSAEVEVAVREVQTAYGEMHGKREAMQALQVEMDYLTSRWELLPGDDRSASFLLGDLLDVQERLAREEFAFARAQTDYTLALAELKRATGTLLQFEQISQHEVDEDCTPRIIFDKPEGPRNSTPPAQVQEPSESGATHDRQASAVMRGDDSAAQLPPRINPNIPAPPLP